MIKNANSARFGAQSTHFCVFRSFGHEKSTVKNGACKGKFINLNGLFGVEHNGHGVNAVLDGMGKAATVLLRQTFEYSKA